MKKIIISILVVMVLLCAVLTGCNNGDTTQTTASQTTTTTHVGVTVPKPQGAAMYEFSRYGYHIYHPQGFEVLNDEGNMVELMNDTGVDFTILVLDNNYESLNAMINAQTEDGDDIVKQGSTYFLVHNESNGRINYTYYYFGEDMVRCELSYPSAQQEAMLGLEQYIMVEPHTHSH
ncbi:MAG: hypothetical protein IKY44_03040 [Clostridia bacterium]|nr:hypothetical protein [Clostridia bacterium]